MGKENREGAVPIIGIHIDLKERAVSLETEEETVARFTLSPEGLTLRGVSLEPAEEEDMPEKEPTVVVTGRIKSKPKEGRVDRSGNPTAWCRLAVHEEGEEGAHLYLASFHRHSREIALSLSRGDQVTVEGYPHPRQDPDRMDTLSVINVLNYPGKTSEPEG